MRFFAGDDDSASVLRALVNAQRGTLGGVQGQSGSIFGMSYPAGGIVDRYVVEPFSGTHDFFNSGIWYDSLGNGRNLSGVSALFGNVMNWTNIPLAVPFAAAAVLPAGVIDALTTRKAR